MAAKYLNVQSLLWLALALALAGSLKHLAAIYASVDGNAWFGWLNAVAIDTGLFALAYQIRIRKSDKRSVKMLWAGIALFTAISIYGNLAYGILATTGTLPDWIKATRPIVLAASLPVLVLFLSELLSDDRQHAAEVAEREARKQAKRSANEPFIPGDMNALALANDTRQAKMESRRERVRILFDLGMTQIAIADELNVSESTVKRDIAALELTGHSMDHNGNGRGNHD